MESNQLPLGQMTLNEMYSPKLVEDSMPAFLSKSTADISLPLQWVTNGRPRLSYEKMSEIAQLVPQVYGDKSTEGFVDISDVRGVSPEEIQKNTRMFPPDCDYYEAEEVVFVGQRSLAAAADPGKVSSPWKEWSRVTCEPFPFSRDKLWDFTIHELGGRVNLEFLMKLECSWSESQTEAKLTISRMDMGVETTCKKCLRGKKTCDRSCGQIFIREVQITVSPDTWAQNCGKLEPIATATEFNIQSTKGHAVQVGIPNPKLTTYTFQSSKTVSCPTRAFGWKPARRGFSSEAVDWRWEFKRFANGAEVDCNARLGCKVPLGIDPDFIQVGEEVSASWVGLPSVDLQQLQQNWHMTIIVQTAVVKGKKLFPGSELKACPTIAFSQDGLTFV